MSESSPFVHPYLLAAGSALELARSSAVSNAWEQPSSLPEMSVGGLTSHLVGQIHSVTATLDEPDRQNKLVGLLEHYELVGWRGAALGESTNTSIREAADFGARNVPSEMVEEAGLVLDGLARELPTKPGAAPVQPPWTNWMLTLDDFLVTRLMEITVHSDDLAFSVGMQTPSLPDEVVEPVTNLLVNLSVQRHGRTALIRALSRAERAPDSINGI
ncbi:MAG TPA: maleylpyruvate isomerase N-terminal domain-containing protein [Actinomycetes bacterium]|nr:maleylpyruvate isomerase N-terminal domain-containing protein [Actinomycetes bacterium]